MVKIIFSDIDGTLINDALKVMPRTRQALRHAVDYRYFICSSFGAYARWRLSQFERFLPDVP